MGPMRFRLLLMAWLTAVFAMSCNDAVAGVRGPRFSERHDRIAPEVVLNTDSVINLVQWTAAEGGNDHWYAILASELYWYEAHDLAPSFMQDGMPAYLATVGSAAENSFILDHVIAGTQQPSILDLFWLNGREIAGSWQWTTGEAMNYQNWLLYEPNNPGVETALSMWGWNSSDLRVIPGKWNDALPDSTVNNLHRWWAVIEWGPYDTAVVPPPPPDTIMNLVQWTEAEGGNGHWYAILTRELYWSEAHDLASTFMQDAMSGYVATVGSAAENTFILDHVIAGTQQPSILDLFWLNGREVAGVWQWTTGETMGYQNWLLYEPNNPGIETALSIWGWNSSDPRVVPGKWNDALPDGTVNTLHRWWAVIEWGPYDTTVVPPEPDTIINLTQWTAAQGGNDHWYAIIPQTMYWDDADAVARTLEHDGAIGYLATVTSAEENAFLIDQVIATTYQPSILDMYWLGGRDIGGEWTWTTGEQLFYTNWSTGEPNNVGIETALGMWGPYQTDYRRIPGKWNNALPNGAVNPYARFYSLVEWGALDTSVVTTDTIVNLVQWSEAEGGNGHWYAVLAKRLHWVDAHALAPAFVQDGMNGYLATVGSSTENAFILNHVIAGTQQPSILDLFWLNGRELDGTWQWTTGEPMSYENWLPYEPNNPGIETALSMWGHNSTDPRVVPGMWNDALLDNSVNSLHKWWSVIEWGDLDAGAPTDSFINLVQWPEADGGNGHWYAIIPQQLYWDDAEALAGSFTVDGTTGYLATATSPEENAFLLDQVIGDTRQPSILDMYWLGGRDLGEAWAWITHEPFSFENWSTGEPNNEGIETALGMWGPYQDDDRRIPGKWNNALPNDSVNPFARFWALVEWGTTTPSRSLSMAAETALPNVFALLPNYPNPFNAGTIIQFDVASESDVRIEVFNVMGQKVCDLVNERMGAGQHVVRWNGLDRGGNAVASGLYFYRLIAGDFVGTRQMLLLK